MAVQCGIDALVADGYRQLRGQRVGLVTNHTGLTADMRSTIDVLHTAPGVQLKALFGPEHGIRGDRDEKIADSIDSGTGLPVYSLYGASNSPSDDVLKDLDALVFDIQDIGCRFYTYISTMGHCLEACARAGIHMVILDRPNPINGTLMEGPIADESALSFVGWHPMPVRHGMTVGELARMFNVERKINAGLIVVPCVGWKRSEYFEELGLVWTNQSPNMRCLNQAVLYPGIGLLETTNLSVGRGTDTPFEHFGSPWLDCKKLADQLQRRRLPGVAFIPRYFTPNGSVFQGQRCAGINVAITNRSQFRPVRTGMEIASAIHRLHPQEWMVDRFHRLLLNETSITALKAGIDPKDIERSWAAGLKAFRGRRSSYLLYE